MLYLASKHFLRIAIGIQQAVKCHPHGLIGGHVRDIPILIVESHHEQNRQLHRFGRGIRKLCPAVILCRSLCLSDQASQIIVLFVVLDTKMGFDLIHSNEY